MAEIIERLANDTATAKDRSTLLAGIAGMSRRQLKAVAVALTGREVYGLKDEIADQVSDLLSDE